MWHHKFADLYAEATNKVDFQNQMVTFLESILEK